MTCFFAATTGVQAARVVRLLIKCGVCCCSASKPPMLCIGESCVGAERCLTWLKAKTLTHEQLPVSFKQLEPVSDAGLFIQSAWGLQFPGQHDARGAGKRCHLRLCRQSCAGRGHGRTPPGELTHCSGHPQRVHSIPQVSPFKPSRRPVLAVRPRPQLGRLLNSRHWLCCVLTESAEKPCL